MRRILIGLITASVFVLPSIAASASSGSADRPVGRVRIQDTDGDRTTTC